MILSDIVLVLGALSFVATLFVWHKKDDAFDLRHILVDSKTQRVSLFKIGQLIALLVSTWALIHETRTHGLTEWLFLAYIATWSGINVANRAIEKQQTKPPEKPNG